MTNLGRRIRQVFVLAILACGLRAETLVIATYNVENYGPANRMTEDGYRKEYPKPEAEKTALRAVIRGLGADVLVVQEMGSQAHLEEFRRDLAREGIDYPHAVLMQGPDEARHVAALSKRPLRSVVAHGDLRFTYFGKTEQVKRGLLEVRIATEAGELAIFGVHLKSRFTDRPDDPQSAIRRVSEAAAVRDAILQRFPDPSTARFLIIGDCNDGRNSRTMERLAQRGRTVVAHVLPAEDSRGETWTHSYRKEGSYSQVDHVLVSPGLRNSVQGEAVRIHDGAEVRGASDHRPVSVTLRLVKP